MRVPVSVWLWLLVALQVAVPASYYLVRRDRDDERFAWRMFSAVRLQRCQVSAYVSTARGRAQVEIAPLLHASWIRSLERGRQRVVDHFLADRCADGIREAQLVRTCTTAAGVAMPAVSYKHRCEVAP